MILVYEIVSTPLLKELDGNSRAFLLLAPFCDIDLLHSPPLTRFTVNINV